MADKNDESEEHIQVHLDIPPKLEVPLELQEQIHTHEVLEI